MYAMQNIVTWA